MNAPTIRQYAPADAPAVAALLTEAARLDPTLQPIDEDGWRRFAGRSFNRGARDFAVAVTGGRLTGVLTSTLMSPAEGPPVRHFRIVVHPEHRRRGIGSALLDLVRGQDPPGTAVLQSNCEDGWDAGRSFLETHGFSLWRRELDMARDGDPPEPVPPPPGFWVRASDGKGPDEAAWIRLDHEGYAGDPNAQWMNAADAALLRSAPGFRLWLAEDGDGPIGLCHAVRDEDGGGWIHSLVVAERARRRGLGRALTVAALRELEGGRTNLGVRADNHGAIALYRSLAFEPTGEVTTWRCAPPA